MTGNLDSVAALSDQKQKIEQYKVVLAQVLESGSADECKQFVIHSKLSSYSFQRIAFLELVLLSISSVEQDQVSAY
jgi:hypothetical protein